MTLRNEKEVTGQALEQRMELVKMLEETDFEQYMIMKDKETGEHYLHYRYIHRDVAAGGAESAYHQLMPLDSDEVLGFLFSEQPFRYPEAWTKPYLRNGPEELYIWYNPAPVFEGEEAEKEAERIREALLRFKRRGTWTEADVERLLNDTGGTEQ